jgi:uncharacterized BrkB/YihY/UPF0761 family membrane protein
MMVLLVVAVGVTVAANALATLFPLAWITGLVIGSAVMVGLLVMLYRFVPNRTFEVRDVVPGALLAGILIEVFSLGFPLYARYAGGFNTYGAQFGLFFLLATWFYIVSQLIMLGAVFIQFRLGQPDAKGLVASPMHESREVRRPNEVIKDKQAEGDHPAAPAPRRPRSFLVALALAITAISRRRKRTPTT